MWSRKKSKGTTIRRLETPSPRPTSPWSSISSSPRRPTEPGGSSRSADSEGPSATPSPTPTRPPTTSLGEIDDDNPIDVDGSAAD